MIWYIIYVQIVGFIIRHMHICLKMDVMTGLLVLYARYLEALSAYLV